MTLGHRIAQLRKERKMSQEELAEKLDVSRQAVSKWENDLSRPDTDNLIRLAQLFEVDINTLVDCEKAEAETRKGKLWTGILAALLAVAVCSTAVFCILWQTEQKAHDKTAQQLEEVLQKPYWDSVTMTYSVRNESVEVELTDAQKILLGQLIWGQEFTPWSEIDDQREILRGGLLACVEFEQGELTYRWWFTPNAFTYSVITSNGDAISYKYSPNPDFLRMLGNQFVRNGFEDDTVIAAAPSDYAPTVGKHTEY